ncbi:MAG: impB/mucB/samB family protein [Sphingomonadales bacterium]|nr:impB/mucB/samB family protein [Sphingomonadales bacterium]
MMFSPSPLRWLYLDFNSYFASVEQQLNPALRGRPVAVVPVESDSSCAIAASYEAKAYGIKTGTAIWEARQLCPDLICVLARHDAYVDYHHRAVAEINRHIPVSAVCSIDEVAAQLMRNEAQPEAARRIALSIKAGLADNLGPWVRCSIGIAANRFLAKVGADLQKPDGLTILMPDEVEARLTAALKPTDLPGIGRNMERRLRRQGIYTMADIFALDRKQMRRVWGSIWGERIYYYLRGFDLPEPVTQRRTIGHSHVLAPSLRPPWQAIYVVRRLTLKAASRLRRMDYYAQRYAISIRLEDGRRLFEEMRFRPAQDSMTFLEMLQEFWERHMLRDRGMLVKKASVVLYGLIHASACQNDLFDPPLYDAPDRAVPASEDRRKMLRLSLALDKINSRFGRDSVLIGMLPSAGRGFSGTKIAFTRIPELAEFNE